MEVKKKILYAFFTYIDLQKFFPFWSEIKVDTVHISRKSASSYQKDDQNKIREERSEVNQLTKMNLARKNFLQETYFSERFNSIPKSEIDNNPSKKQTNSKFPTYGAKIVDSFGYVQHEIAEIENIS